MFGHDRQHNGGPIPLRNFGKRLPGPVGWYGGKGTMASKIVPLIPDTRVYCEPYGGAGSILCALEPRMVEVYNDLDSRLVNLFRVLQNPETRERLRERLEFTLHSLDEFRLALKTMDDPDADPVDAAWGFFTAQNQAFGGVPVTEGNWGRVFVSGRGMAATVSKWRSRVARIEEWGKRFAQVQVDNRDALEVIKYWDSPETTFYLDPPYVFGTRIDPRGYRHEASDKHHKALIQVLLNVEGCCVLSGYAHEIYAPLDAAGWKRVTFQRSCNAAGRARSSKVRGKGNALKHAAREEVLWLNPAIVEWSGQGMLPILQ